MGNDIVDLKAAGQHTWKRKRLLDKVLQSSEKELVLSSFDPSTCFWILWSMKESAYKLHFRQNLKRALNPIRFECFYDGPGRGRVQFDNSVFQTCTLVTKEFVHTIAWKRDPEVKLIRKVVTAYGSNIRNKTINSMIRSFSKEKGLDPKDVRFEKDANGLPFLNREDRALNHICSMSHHGRFGAFAFA